MTISIEGHAFYGKVTKQLLHDVSPHSIIIIEQEDVDLIAAEDIVRKKVKAVINTRETITGKLPRSGIFYLLENHIPIFDIESTYTHFDKKMKAKIEKNKLFLYKENKWIDSGSLFPYTVKEAEEKKNMGQKNYPHLFTSFAANSFTYARKELPVFLQAVNQLPIIKEMEGKSVFIVARGSKVDMDIRLLRSILSERDCITIAVDGAASLLIEEGILPHFVVGDMDSLPQSVLSLPVQFITHAYMNGSSPGQERLKGQALNTLTVPFPGLSEDLAIMLAYVSQARHIYTLGCRNSVVELVEKGRKGMGSTLLTRMYSGEKITDCKSLSSLFHTLADEKNRNKRLLLDELLSLQHYLKEYENES